MTPETTIDVSPAQSNAIQPVDTATDEKRGNHLEHVETDLGNLRYDDEDEEPELHMKTWIALAALIFMQMTMIMAVQGPPPAVSDEALLVPKVLLTSDCADSSASSAPVSTPRHLSRGCRTRWSSPWPSLVRSSLSLPTRSKPGNSCLSGAPSSRSWARPSPQAPKVWGGWLQPRLLLVSVLLRLPSAMRCPVRFSPGDGVPVSKLSFLSLPMKFTYLP